MIANLVNRIQPLDTSVVSKSLSDSAKDSMKETISSMLGLLPSDQFSVSVTISEQPLYRLLISSIITGYTLWNAEYRVSLTRNYDIVSDPRKEDDQASKDDVSEKGVSEGLGDCVEELERMSPPPQVFGDLSPEALSYIQELQSELTCVKEELDSQKKKALQIECEKGSKNDLLEYLRSLDAEMVTELSQLSSPEVEEIVSQLVQNVMERIFEDQNTSALMQGSVIRTTESGGDGASRTVDASRDYLAKLLFWCMLLGHHLRGLENRLHLSCVVGLL